MAMRALSSRLSGRHARINQGQLDVVQRRGARQQVERLETRTRFPIADSGQFVVGHVADQVAVDEVLPAGRRIQTAIRFIRVDLPDPRAP